ncbi:hypothetical protein [Kingella sp. (in: b-proteobacteria)]|uniref:hypothetical protein n=1 Tax=Kingella sp. (in: b-proteobacteria) TaxID=2020713 RepID=UPI0026DBF3FC|nr:hypothetical protein [Kingella sp. (in: b-proteobacteria)]MDO4657879.1 hypothetical protein [Kingella sp. (in: b-proteobacteria)]
MAYRRHTHSYPCRSANISGCLQASQRQPEKHKRFFRPPQMERRRLVAIKPPPFTNFTQS